MHCRRPKGAHRRALCLATRARRAGSNSAHLIWQDRLLFARRGPRDRRRPALPAFVRPNRPRECAVQGATMIVKVGVQGRVILDRWAVHLAAKRSHFHVHPGSHLWMCARAGRRRGIKHGISQHA